MKRDEKNKQGKARRGAVTGGESFMKQFSYYWQIIPSAMREIGPRKYSSSLAIMKPLLTLEREKVHRSGLMWWVSNCLSLDEKEKGPLPQFIISCYLRCGRESHGQDTSYLNRYEKRSSKNIFCNRSLPQGTWEGACFQKITNSTAMKSWSQLPEDYSIGIQITGSGSQFSSNNKSYHFSSFSSNKNLLFHLIKVLDLLLSKLSSNFNHLRLCVKKWLEKVWVAKWSLVTTPPLPLSI